MTQMERASITKTAQLARVSTGTVTEVTSASEGKTSANRVGMTLMRYVRKNRGATLLDTVFKLILIFKEREIRMKTRVYLHPVVKMCNWMFMCILLRAQPVCENVKQLVIKGGAVKRSNISFLLDRKLNSTDWTAGLSLFLCLRKIKSVELKPDTGGGFISGRISGLLLIPLKDSSSGIYRTQLLNAFAPS